MRQARQWCVGLFDGEGIGMDKESLDATVKRFRLHGFGHEQAIMMAEAIAFALEQKEFAVMVGNFGMRHLRDAVDSMRMGD